MRHASVIPLRLALVFPLSHGEAQDPPVRRVAVTFDDLPATRIPSLADARALTTKLLDELAALRIPAIGFVNEGKPSRLPRLHFPA